MITIHNNKVAFSKKQHGQNFTLCVEAKLEDDKSYIQIPAIGDLQLEDVAEFSKAIEIAVMIARGELEVI